MQLVKVALENEMDLTLAYKKSIKAAELIGFSVSTQTAFATAVSEVCREVIDKTHDGIVSIEIHSEEERHQLAAIVTYLETEDLGNLDEGLQYAQKLVPVFNSSVSNLKGLIELKISIPRSARGNRTKFMGIKNYFTDLEPATPYEEIKQRNQQLYLINEQSEIALQQSEYLNKQKNEFLMVASHELKTPLTILRAYTQMALKSDCSPVTLAHLKKVDDQALKIQTMIKQLLDVSKIENDNTEYNMEITESNKYLLNLTDLIMQLAPDHHIIANLDDNVILKIDKLRIEQVLMNIVGNAAKYSPAGQQIVFSTNIRPDGYLQISIQDFGIGMSKDELQKIFNKFYRVESVVKQYNGFGVGLYVSSKIILDHGGKIWVESIDKKGCTFIFTLPVHKL
ncbi:MAG TPA: HAMP domain-containing sensor histidine kinase [Pedobacter sp.]